MRQANDGRVLEALASTIPETDSSPALRRVVVPKRLAELEKRHGGASVH